jgi:hypothetical protein
MAEAPAITWLDFDRELSCIYSAVIKLDHDLLLAVANHREEYHLNEILKRSFA